MKQGRKLYRNEKEILKRQHLNPEEYTFLGEHLVDNRPSAYFRVQHKQTGNIKIICRYDGRKGQ